MGYVHVVPCLRTMVVVSELQFCFSRLIHCFFSSSTPVSINERILPSIQLATSSLSMATPPIFPLIITNNWPWLSPVPTPFKPWIDENMTWAVSLDCYVCSVTFLTLANFFLFATRYCQWQHRGLCLRRLEVSILVHDRTSAHAG